ncbi:methyltransferase family protein [Methanobacterium oryzae]|uniref:methyltransferase family protein n=1 Tax=Methanobacterium oryzae TaxID=69540 RepID=UPI003D25F036
MNLRLSKNLIPRILLLILFLVPIIYFNGFYYHFYVYLSSNVITGIITRQWHIVILCILLFMAFLIPLSYRRKANWVEYGLVSAFFISLFIEMYGIPLTVLFASKYFFTPGIQLPPNIVSFYFLGVGFGMDIAMTYGAILMLIGMFIIIIGWIKLYRSTKKDGLVTDGIYAYSRHPQYLGFILIILGWFFGWPTIITLVLAPILIYKYIKVCKTEEKEISKEFPEYKEYKENVPLFI